MSLLEEIKKSGVAVWHKPTRKFIFFIPCPGEKRVRLDVHDDLDNYVVVKAKYRDDATMDNLIFDVVDNRPLPYQIDWS
jgi:hypothetical protein